MQGKSRKESYIWGKLYKVLKELTAKHKIFFPNLDGLRFLSFLSVFLFHSFYTEYDWIRNSEIYIFLKRIVLANGNIGVNFFFVLSGFLITFLLIKEKEYEGKINIVNFWIRRILRIWPLYFLCVFFGFVIFPYIKQYFGQTPAESANPIYYLTFLNNFDFLDKANKGCLPDCSVLVMLWSIAVEEQFYLVWPVFLAVIPTRRYPLFFALIIIGTFVFRAAYDNPLYHEHHTFSCIGDMAVGAFGAYLATKNKFKIRLENLNRGFIVIMYLVFFFIYLFRKDIFFSNSYIRIFERFIVAVAILFIILEQNYSRNSFFKMSKFKTISNLGLITYGLYCLHFVGILIAIYITKKLNLNTNLWEVLILETVLSLLITIFISWISFRYFESFFLKFKSRFSVISR